MSWARLHVRAAKYLAGGGEPLTLNLGRREGDPPVLIASAEAARRVVGWKPQFGDLDVIVETAWKWRQRFPEGYPA